MNVEWKSKNENVALAQVKAKKLTAGAERGADIWKYFFRTTKKHKKLNDELTVRS